LQHSQPQIERKESSIDCKFLQYENLGSQLDWVFTLIIASLGVEDPQKPVPMHRTLRDASVLWRNVVPTSSPRIGFSQAGVTRGRRPYWGQAILREYIRPVARRLGIQKRFGWHTFRHTDSTLLRSVGTEFKVMQELLRHSTLRSTLDVYTQAVTPANHAAQAAVMSLVFPPRRMEGYSFPGKKLPVIEKGPKKGAKRALFAPLMVSMKSA
jgi:hypothetical protein